MNWVVINIDIETIVVEGQLEEEIYVNLSPLWEEFGKRISEGDIEKLYNVIYGLSQYAIGLYSKIGVYLMQIWS